MKEIILHDIRLDERNGFELCPPVYKSYFNPINNPEKINILSTNIFQKSFRTGMTVILKKK